MNHLASSFGCDLSVRDDLQPVDEHVLDASGELTRFVESCSGRDCSFIEDDNVCRVVECDAASLLKSKNLGRP